LLPGRGTRLKGHTDAIALLAAAARGGHGCAVVDAWRGAGRDGRTYLARA
jgi:hypothetical protein